MLSRVPALDRSCLQRSLALTRLSIETRIDAIPASTNALVAHKAVAALFSVLGFVFNLVLLGVIVERIRMRIARF